MRRGERLVGEGWSMDAELRQQENVVCGLDVMKMWDESEITSWLLVCIK